MNNQLMKPFLVEEIWEVVKGLGLLKELGRDDFPGLFYKKYWSYRRFECL